MEEKDDNIVVLVDENGENVEFEHLDTIEMDGSEYVVLLPLEEGNGDGEVDEVIILKIERNDDGEDTFITVEDENILNEVFEEFKERMEEFADFEEDEEE